MTYLMIDSIDWKINTYNLFNVRKTSAGQYGPLGAGKYKYIHEQTHQSRLNTQKHYIIIYIQRKRKNEYTSKKLREINVKLTK